MGRFARAAAVGLAAIAAVVSAREALAADAEECATGAEHAADLRDLGKLREAARLFEGCARDACPRIVREDCRKGLADIRDRGPRVVPRVHDAAGRDVLDARVTLDGEEIAGEAQARGVLVDPGTHVLRALRAGRTVAQETVLVAVSDGTRSVDLVVPAASPAASPLALAPVAPPSRAPSYVVGAVGLAALATGAVLGTWTYVDYKRLGRECGPRCDASVVDPVRTRGIVADVALGLGVAAVAVAIVLRLTESPAASSRREAVLAW